MIEKDISRVRAEAGRKGAAALRAKLASLLPREKTTQIRIYTSDAATIRSMPGYPADNVRTLLRSR